MTGPQRLSFFAQLSNCNLSQSCHIRGSPLRPFPRVLLCLLNIPKIRIKTVHVIGCSLSLQNLHISYYCSSVFWKYGQSLVEYGQAIDPQNLSLSSHPLLKKARTFGLGRPPPSLNKHNRFQYTAPSHLENWSGGGGGPGQKARLFVTEGKSDSTSKASMPDCGMNGHLFILTYYASIRSVEKACMWHVVPVSNHLLDTESEFAPRDPRKAHILV